MPKLKKQKKTKLNRKTTRFEFSLDCHSHISIHIFKRPLYYTIYNKYINKMKSRQTTSYSIHMLT